MSFSKAFALICSIVLHLPALAAVDSYQSYFLNDFPSSPAGCANTAAQVGARLASETGVKIWSAECSADLGQKYDLKIVYISPVPLEKITTVHADVSEYPGVYASGDDCAADLQNQVTLFTQSTGLDPIVAYCAFQPFYGWQYPWTLHIDGFSTHAKAAIGNSFRFYDFVGRLEDEARTQLLLDITQNAARQKLILSSAVVGQDLAYLPRLVIDYYAKHQSPLWLWHRLEFDNLPSCQNQLADVRKGLTAAGVDPLAVFCSGSNDSAMVGVLGLDDGSVEYFQAPQSYATLRACWDDRARVMQAYRDQNKWDVRYAFCEGNSRFGNFGMYLLHKHPATKNGEPSVPPLPAPPVKAATLLSL